MAEQDEEYNQRAHMKEAIAEGGSVYHRGRIITSHEHLPTEADLAKGDPARAAAVRRELERRKAELDEQIASLGEGGGAAGTNETVGAQGDELPEDFPGREALAKAGIHTRSEVASFTTKEELMSIEGVDDKTAARILKALK